MSEPSRASVGQLGDEFADVIRAAQEDIATGVDRAGWRDDPLRHPMAALSTTIGLFPGFLERMEAVAERMRCPVTDDELSRLQAAVIRGADRRAAELARAHNRRTLLFGGLAVVVGLAVAAGGGALWGAAAANERVRETERRLAIAFQDGPDAAAAWVNLMEQNDVLRALNVCKGSHAFVDQSGRKACALPVFLEPPARPVPASALR